MMVVTKAVGVLTVRRANDEARDAMKDWDQRFREYLIEAGLLTPARVQRSCARTLILEAAE